MVSKPVARLLPDGRRLHLQHGPIDLVIEAFGASDQVALSYQRASQAFDGVLQRLVDELATLRSPAMPAPATVNGPVATRMMRAVRPYAQSHFVTPMAAVAGSVADHMADAIWRGADLQRLYVNNGGDIALRLKPGQQFNIAVCANPATGADGGRICVNHDDGIGGIATSGWRGRSQSLGIADAVTVLARDGASADVAATLVANAVDLPVADSRVQRTPARCLSPDSDLEDRLVTIAVGRLDARAIELALAAGMRLSIDLCGRGLIEAAVLNLQAAWRVAESQRCSGWLTVPAGQPLGPTDACFSGLCHAVC